MFASSYAEAARAAPSSIKSGSIRCEWARQLSTNRSPEDLNLRWSRSLFADEAAVVAFADALGANTSTVLLNLANCNITDVEARHLARALKTNRTLEVLNLWHNSISDEGARELADALAVNPVLRELDLFYNAIGEDGCNCLERTVSSRGNDFKLDLEGNPGYHENRVCVCLTSPRCWCRT